MQAVELFKYVYGSDTYQLCDRGQTTQDFPVSVSLSAKLA